MYNWKHRVLSAMLSLCMLASMLLTAIPATAAEEMVNVALNGNASTSDGEYRQNVIGNVIDGNPTTNWQTEGKWPSTAVVQLDMGRSISEVVVRLAGDDMASRSVTIVVEYAQNGVTSDLIHFGEQTISITGDMTARFTVSQPVSATHFYVTLKDPLQDGAVGTFWPCIGEIEIYEKQDVKLSDYNNIATQADITATGNNEHPDEGSANLVDGNTGTLYKFFKDQLTSEQSVYLTFEQPRSMDAFVIAFEHVDPEPYNYAFTYSILARNGDGEYDTIVERFTANRTDKYIQQYKFLEKTYSEIQIVMHSCTNNTGNYIGWPAIAEFEVYGSEVTVADGCISNGKSVHASSGQSLAKNITDGSKNSVWRGSYYPAYVDIDLGANYFLDAVQVFTPENGYSQYSIYTSMNGRDFTKLAEKTSRAAATLEDGESYAADRVEARIVRVYLEYNSAETAAVIHEVRVLGEASGTAVQQLPNIAVVDFEESAYADTTVTDQDTYNEVYGIIERRLGPAYKSWFTLELAPSSNGYDYFELSTQGGKVHVRGNDGVSLATGINHYLKYYCNVNISQVGDQVTMPADAPSIPGTVHKETKAEVRYSYNYCTLSYSMAFWGETEWRNELDWLALNGVNVVLDATAQEEVWRRFLGELGYTHQEAKDYIAGPAYYAWAYMANLSGFGGPVHDSWFEERTELARKNQQIMRNLGMQPVLQGYSGMVPTDIASKATGTYALTSSDIIAQGNWCSFQRPAMLRTTSEAFDKYAALFYECQAEVYGDTSDYYATDPFHEGGNTGGMNSRDIAREVLTSMLAADQDAIWIIQAWQGNPTTALLNGLDDVENGAQHALVLDLYAEKTPHNQETGSSYGDTKEFDDTPWLYCMLNNFGGRLGLHGHLDNMARKIPEAFNNGNHIAGIGITPEASVNNPVLYDFLFETIWQDDASQNLQEIDLDTWLDEYATRRYGAESEGANSAWDILKETVYKSSLNNLGQGAPESVVNARPALNINAASTWGNAVVSYDKVQLEEAALLLLEDYETLSASKGYMYDVANVLQQVLSNSAQEYQKKMTAAFNSRDLEAFESAAATFLEIIDYMETVTATSEYFLLGRWVEQAKALGKNADDFTKDLYALNAKALVTTWGSYNQAESGGLKDYSNRQWAGLIGDFYKVRWERWITARTNELKGESYESSINWFQWEWEWVRSNTTYTTRATAADLETLGYEIIEKFTSANPAADASNDIDPTTMEVYAEDYEPNNDTEGDPNYVKDGNPATFWHTVWAGSDRSTHYLIFTFEDVTAINGMRFLQRPSNGINGVVTKYDLLVRESEDDEWTLIVDDGTLATDASWQLVSFEAVDALQVKFQVVDARSDNTKKFAAAAEIRFTAPEEAECQHTGGSATCQSGPICELCNQEYGQPNPDAHNGGEATCETGKICDRCGEEYTNALGHDYGEPNIIWNDDNTATATVTCANDETHVEVLNVTVTSTITEGDCENEAVTTYTATVIFQDKTYTSTKDVEGELGECADKDHNHKCDICGEDVGEHVAAEGSHDCDYCGEPASECADEEHDHVCDICGERVGDHEAAEGSHDCEYCGEPISKCTDKATDGDHKCDICGEPMEDAECTDADKDHKCDDCKENVGKHEAAEGTHDCEYCGEPISKCTDKATDGDHKCDVCGEPMKDAACADSNKDHKCDDCRGNVGEHKDANKDHKCDYGCSEAMGTCEDKNNDGKCDYGCGKDFEVKPTEPKPTEPKPTEPKPTEPKPTEPKPTEPKPTEPKPTEPEAPKVEGVTRLAGENRLDTSELIANQLKEKMGVEKFENIIVASGGTFADALPGSYLAAMKNAPILLTLAKDKYVDQTAEYIKANLAEGGTVYILGGESAVPSTMETALAGLKVQRVAGDDRFGTNLAILKAAGIKAGEEVLVCTAREFADSLSAAATGKPILLVYKKLTAEQKAYLATLSGCKFTLVGGTTAIPTSFEDELASYGDVARLAGKDRLETSVLVAEKYFPDATTTVIAYGWDFPDGLCGGSLAYAIKSPLILAHPKEKLFQYTADYTVSAGLKVGYVLGGDKLVTDDAAHAIFGMDSESITVLK